MFSKLVQFRNDYKTYFDFFQRNIFYVILSSFSGICKLFSLEKYFIYFKVNVFCLFVYFLIRFIFFLNEEMRSIAMIFWLIENEQRQLDGNWFCCVLKIDSYQEWRNHPSREWMKWRTYIERKNKAQQKPNRNNRWQFWSIKFNRSV